MEEHSLGLKLVIMYKGFLAAVMAVLAIASAWSWRNYEAIPQWAEGYLVNGEYSTIEWIVHYILHHQVSELQLIARIASVYALGLGTATLGLWYGKSWGNFLVTLLAGLPLPVEVWQSIHHPSANHVILLGLNLLVFFYLLNHLQQQQKMAKLS
ncbi:DUF2127 domain-containing protein [Roseofilum reptotaenium CS-1145]|uniref:DUF2127 domain-containing protein n=1 Tax=Roseofilum reptotaenium AO1-A TaxID=1925591 RepID=A0A1L9QTQ9_9CYAN|nr:DUF2127 domain-containing protein [Roseofilum reptotaenium]MDB9518970.1 DUF2127 domain-containing protein [Roseofilum reptotaenium CS-1145]OJJ25977.1 hypothetical protein BI308_08430 [Roseofilum reptotaenium AO1-A]